jgi:hypothetical protein
MDVYTPVPKQFTFYAVNKDDANFQDELAVVGVSVGVLYNQTNYEHHVHGH